MAKAKNANPSVDETIYDRGENYYPVILYKPGGLTIAVGTVEDEQAAIDDGWKWHISELHGEDIP